MRIGLLLNAVKRTRGEASDQMAALRLHLCIRGGSNGQVATINLGMQGRIGEVEHRQSRSFIWQLHRSRLRDLEQEGQLRQIKWFVSDYLRLDAHIPPWLRRIF